MNARAFLALCLAVTTAGCASTMSPEAELLAAGPPGAGDDYKKYLVVDCLLPPQLIRQGERAVHMLPSRPAKMSARLCAQQGGAQTPGIWAWKTLADAGNAEAQTYLGEMYEHGIGGAPKDAVKAIDLYTRAWKAGNVRAASNLALLYANGAPGIPSDIGKAEEFVQKATAAAAGVDTRTIAVVPVVPGQPQVSAPGLAGLDLKRFSFGHYHALLIGNSDYLHAPVLKSPVYEIDVLGKVLEQKYDFKVVKLKNATRDEILKKLDDMDMELKESDNLLVYYTGHGAESETKEGYWIPVDGEGPTSDNKLRTRLWVSSSDLRNKLSVMAPKHVLVIADSCYSARFLQFKGSVSAAADLSPAAYLHFGKLYAAKSRTALTSGGLAPVIEPNDGSNMSLFAKALVQYLERNRDPVASVQIFSNISMDVINGTSKLGFPQQPQWGPITGAGHESGDFWFRPK